MKISFQKVSSEHVQIDYTYTNGDIKKFNILFYPYPNGSAAKFCDIVKFIGSCVGRDGLPSHSTNFYIKPKNGGSRYWVKYNHNLEFVTRLPVVFGCRASTRYRIHSFV